MMPQEGQEALPQAKKSKRSARRRSREFVLQGLYASSVGASDEAAIEAHLSEVEGFGKIDDAFFKTLLRGILAQQETLKIAIEMHLDRPFKELSPIEASILLIGAFELKQHLETPYRVIINEAIELAKGFGGTDGHKYVNGVLDKLAAQWRPDELAARRR